MDKKQKIFLIFLFAYLALFPFGQLPRLMMEIAQFPTVFHLVDIIVIIAACYVLIKEKIKISSFFVIIIFSWIINLPIFGLSQSIFPGLLYLIRFIAYPLFFYGLKKHLKNKHKKLIINSLLAIGLIIAVAGLVQYIFIPDLRILYSLGWDDHYYRLTSTFFDPAFTGILLVFALLLAISEFLSKKDKRLLILGAFTATALALTYSRASYLAFIGGILFLLVDKVAIKKLAALIFAVSIALFIILPKPAGEGVNLLRTYSAVAKWENSLTGWQIFRASPLLGVGFNNMCAAKGDVTGSHSCSGLDNSILFILATTGILGLISFAYLVTSIFKKNKSKIFLATAIALFIHMQFTNTLFYPWVMGWIGILWSISDNNS